MRVGFYSDSIATVHREDYPLRLPRWFLECNLQSDFKED